jgi:hypothetical protein
MKNNLRLRATAILGTAGALLLGSCAYDPYYSGGSYTSVGYGSGYGYGNSSFSTSLFVSTGNSRWGYDPHCRSYYDYTRRCYYDPYLYGYYPVGYRPPVVVGVPHPHGWSPGRSYCPPPSRITNVRLTNYNDRESAYRRTNYSWARDVRIDRRQTQFHPPTRGNSPGWNGSQNQPRPSSGGFFGRQEPSRQQSPFMRDPRDNGNLQSPPPSMFPSRQPTRENQEIRPGGNRGGFDRSSIPQRPMPSMPQRPNRFNSPVSVPPDSPEMPRGGRIEPQEPTRSEPRIMPTPSAPPSAPEGGVPRMDPGAFPDRGERRMR